MTINSQRTWTFSPEKRPKVGAYDFRVWKCHNIWLHPIIKAKATCSHVWILLLIFGNHFSVRYSLTLFRIETMKKTLIEVLFARFDWISMMWHHFASISFLFSMATFNWRQLKKFIFQLVTHGSPFIEKHLQETSNFYFSDTISSFWFSFLSPILHYLWAAWEDKIKIHINKIVFMYVYIKIMQKL